MPPPGPQAAATGAAELAADRRSRHPFGLRLLPLPSNRKATDGPARGIPRSCVAPARVRGSGALRQTVPARSPSTPRSRSARPRQVSPPREAGFTARRCRHSCRGGRSSREVGEWRILVLDRSCKALVLDANSLEKPLRPRRRLHRQEQHSVAESPNRDLSPLEPHFLRNADRLRAAIIEQGGCHI